MDLNLVKNKRKLQLFQRKNKYYIFEGSLTIYPETMKKRIFYISILSLCFSYVFAQRKGFIDTNTTMPSAKKYFTENLSLLDEIEGIYDVSMIPHFSGNNVPFGFRSWDGKEFNTTAYICKQLSGAFIISFTDTKGVSISQSMRLVPLPNTNVYKLEGSYSESYSHFNTSGVLNFAISKRIVFDRFGFSLSFSGNDQFHKVDMEMTFVKTFPSPVNIAKDCTGTGFALGEGYVVTNYHVVENSKSISVQGVNGEFYRKYDAELVFSDKINDLAIIKVNGVNILSDSIPYAVMTNTSEVGEEVFVLGYPLTSTMGEEIKLTTGVISSKTGFQGDISSYQVSAPVHPGNSGAPLFDSKGNIIGIISAKHKSVENVGYAIKTSFLKNLIDSTMPTNILPKTNKLTKYSLSDKVKLAKNYIYYIVSNR